MTVKRKHNFKKIAAILATTLLLSGTTGVIVHQNGQQEKAILHREIKSQNEDMQRLQTKIDSMQEELDARDQEKKSLEEELDRERYLRKQAEISRGYGRKIWAEVTAYTSNADECGKSDGITASGKRAIAGRTIAMDNVPFGTKVRINGQIYIVEDRFGGGYTNKIDIYVDSKEEAFLFGKKNIEVEIL